MVSRVMQETPPMSMWLKDLDELEKKLDDIDSKEAEEERRRLSQANKRATSRGVTLVAKKPPRKNNKKANNVELEADIVANSSMDVGKVAEVAKPKGRGGSRKAPPKKDDDEVQSLQECLAAYKLDLLVIHQQKALIAEDHEDQEDFLIPDNSRSILDDEPKMSIIYSAKLPIKMRSVMEIFDGGNFERRIMEKSRWKVFVYWIGTEPFLYIANVHTCYGEELGKAQCVLEMTETPCFEMVWLWWKATTGTITALRKTRLLTPEQKAQIAEGQEDQEDLLMSDDSGMFIIYSAKLSIKIGNNEGWIVNEVMTLHGVLSAEVLDLVGYLGKTVKVEFNGRLLTTLLLIPKLKKL
ncbi:hypothetical protein L6164_006397 [Bauhinia variegata]|uniref:Uncharacterized protein n=1 Tax=Bauhinia variegata TaxID=167791 RepID=A0ACB9PUE8_BAUVA|nr:hypothetical protein L6164_006397 [Bauhinia variegata]